MTQAERKIIEPLVMFFHEMAELCRTENLPKAATRLDYNAGKISALLELDSGK